MAIPFYPMPTITPPTFLGVPTLEARHEWDAGRIVIHGVADVPSAETPYRYHCKAIGLGGQGEPTLPSTPRTGTTGDRPLPGSRGGRVVVYEGEVQAIDAAWLRYACSELDAAFDDLEQEREMRVLLDPAYMVGEWTFRARGTLSGIEDSFRSGSSAEGRYRATFVLALSLTDPYVYAPPVALDDVLAPDPREPFALPWTLPVTLPTPEVYDYATTVDIASRKPTPLRIRIDGPVINPVLTDETRQVVLALDLELAAGEWVDLDLAEGEASTAAGPLAPGVVRWPDSTWWDTPYQRTPAGPLALRLTADWLDEPAAVSISYRPAS